jgi:hypothetical protein
MIHWIKLTALCMALFIMSVVFMVGCTVSIIDNQILVMPRAPGIWAVRNLSQYDINMILPQPWKLKLEIGDTEITSAKEPPIWNQNRSGDAFVAFILSLILPWIVSGYFNSYSASANLFEHIMWKMSCF